MSLSKTAALRAAQNACGSVYRRSGTDFVCMVPYRRDQPSGPTTELQSYSYPRAVRMRSRVVAEITLVLMGAWRSEEFESDSLIEEASYSGITSASGIVDFVLEHQEAQS